MAQLNNPDADLDGRTAALIELAYTIIGLWTFDRGSGNAPFAVGSGAALVANLDAEKLGGQLAASYRDASNLDAGTLPDARLPNPLPAVSAENLTNLPKDSGLSQSFRGLHLCTHPDADKAASQVMLVHADEIVMHDGTRVADWDDLVADITASGAGGLDTGSEGASRWYSIHAIRKSSDGTKGLMLHRAKSFDIDQELNTGDDNDSVLRFSAGTEKRAQVITAGLTGPMVAVDVKLLKTGSPVGNVWAAVYATSGGAPTGAALATSRKLDASLMSTASTGQWIKFIFDTPLSLTAATVYAIALEGDYAVDGTNHLRWRIDSSSPPYAGGGFATFDGSSWSVATTVDAMFRTYVSQNDTALTMPADYDQHAHVGWVYNGSGSDFRQFVAQDRVIAMTEVSVFSGANPSVSTLVDLSTVIPPVALAGSLAYAIGTDNERVQIGVVPGGYESGNTVAFRHILPITNIISPTVVIAPTEAQALYVRLGSGTNNFSVAIQGFTW